MHERDAALSGHVVRCLAVRRRPRYEGELCRRVLVALPWLPVGVREIGHRKDADRSSAIARCTSCRRLYEIQRYEACETTTDGVTMSVKMSA